MSVVVRFVRDCCYLERRLGTLYSRLAETLDDEKAAQLCAVLAAEEEAHAQSLELLQRLLARSADCQTLVPGAQLDARTMRRGLDTAHAMLDAGKRIGTAEALRLAIRIEASGFESLGVNQISGGDAEVERTLRMLQVADQTHRERLEACLTALGEAPPGGG